MEITVLYFSVLRDSTGTDREVLVLPEEGATVAVVLEQIRERHPALGEWRDRTLIALNCRFAEEDEIVRDGDELALMPPVQGG